MKCPECGVNLDGGLTVCPECGVKLPESAIKEKKPDSKFFKMMKLILILAVVSAAVIISIVVAVRFSASEGKRVAEKLSEKLGRSIALAEKNLDIELSSDSDYKILREIRSYDYQLSSEKAVKVEGIHLPEWVIFVKADSEDKISEVTYYDFRQLLNSWKGEKASAGALPEDQIDYGMTVKEMEKALGFEPLFITYTEEDTIVYRYKYYYVNEVDNNEHAYYLIVEFDLDGHIRDYKKSENKYMSSILK